MNILNVTAEDIATGKYTFHDVHPETCTDFDLRNVKANAFAATHFAAGITDKDRAEANSAMCGLLKMIGAHEGWSADKVLDVAMIAIQWGIAVNKANDDFIRESTK